MHLKFKVKGNKIERKNIQVLASSKSKCSFSFSKEWASIEKYVIFWNKKEKSIIEYLGKGDECKCKMPKEILKDNVFSIQVYANDNLVTQKLKLGAIPDGYTISRKNKCTYDNKDPEVILYQVFAQLESKIDNILYNNGFLECYANNKLVCKTPIFRNLEDEIQTNIKKLMPYFEVEENGNIYVIYPYEKNKKENKE